MVLSCPKCKSAMQSQRVVPEGQRRPTEVHLCGRCKGLWLDRQALDTVCPTLSHLPDRRTEAVLTGKRGAALTACPRCSAVPVELEVLEVAIDFCPGCGGVWLDAGEYQESDFAGGPPPPEQAEQGPYRQQVVDERDPVLRCAYCGAVVDRARATVRERGLACSLCHFALEQRLAALRAEVGPLEAFLRRVEEVMREPR